MADTVSFQQLQQMGAQPVAPQSSGQPAAGNAISFDDLQKMGAQPIAASDTAAPTPPPAPVNGTFPAIKDALTKLPGQALETGKGILKNVADTAITVGKSVLNGPFSGIGIPGAGLSVKLPGTDKANAVLDDTSTQLKPSNYNQKVGYYGTDAASLLLPGPDIIKGLTTVDKSKAAAKAVDFMNRALGNYGKKSVSGLITNDSKRLKGLETLYTMTNSTPIKATDGTTFQFDPTKITEPSDLLQAFRQAKDDIWSRVQDNLQRGSSVKPDYSAVKSGLQQVIDDPGSTAQARSHATPRLAEIANLSKGDVGAAQRYLQQLNSRLGATFSGASDAIPNQIDAQIANGVNKALDAGLAKVTDASIRPLKDQYASLKALEPDIVKMVQKTLRQTGGGIPQYINDFGNINLFEAIFAHNPALFVARGLGEKVLARVFKGQRDPLDNLSKAFKHVSSYLGDAKPPTDPVTLALPPGVRGAPSQVTGDTKLLPDRAQSTIDAAERGNPAIKPPQNDLPLPAQLESPGKNPIQLPPTAAPAAGLIPAAVQPAHQKSGVFPTDPQRLNQANDPLSYVRTNTKITSAHVVAAIEKVETGGVQKKGASGEFGSFQFLPGTWKTVSKQMTGQVLAQTPQNEKRVATLKITQLYNRFLKEGSSAVQAARKTALVWNTSLGGSEQPLIKKGVNKEGVKYDSGKYAARVVASLPTLN